MGSCLFSCAKLGGSGSGKLTWPTGIAAATAVSLVPRRRLGRHQIVASPPAVSTRKSIFFFVAILRQDCREWMRRRAGQSPYSRPFFLANVSNRSIS
jgi:hypothetical protein